MLRTNPLTQTRRAQRRLLYFHCSSEVQRDSKLDLPAGWKGLLGGVALVHHPAVNLERRQSVLPLHQPSELLSFWSSHLAQA